MEMVVKVMNFFEIIKSIELLRQTIRLSVLMY